MKKYFILAFSFFLLAHVQAQNNFPTPSDNPFWLESHSLKWACSTQGTYGLCDGYICRCDRPVYYKSDTIINGNTYNRLYTRGICSGDYYSPAPAGCPQYFYYNEPEWLLATIRQDTSNNIVYIRDDNQNTDVVLYDFNLQVGQVYPNTYNNNSTDTLVVVSEDSIMIGNSYARKWELGIKSNDSIAWPGYVSIIEGVGSTFGIVSPLALPFENNHWLSCYSLDDIVLYPDSTAYCDKSIGIKSMDQEKLTFSLYPNPTKNYLNISINNMYPVKGELKVINVNGTEVFRSIVEEELTQIDIGFLCKGVYFIQFSNENHMLSKMFMKQ